VYQFDSLDIEILRILQKDGRASNVSIAKRIGVGHTRVRDRILRMEDAGVIEGYRVLLNPMALGRGIMCIVQLKVDQGYDFAQLVEQLMGLDEVIEVSNVTGNFDAHVRIWARDVAHLRDLLYNKLSALPAHKSTNSTIVLKRWEKPLGISDLDMDATEPDKSPAA
jgi:Lrp/AsnC family transcriptional regulator for asnA, asnC and gidA